jgi:hypothetical protein
MMFRDVFVDFKNGSFRVVGGDAGLQPDKPLQQKSVATHVMQALAIEFRWVGQLRTSQPVERLLEYLLGWLPQ